MGFRFRKSINLGGGVRLNLNKKSAGISFGGKGFRYSINSNGRKTATAGIPGTGLYYTKSSGGGKKKNGKYQKASNNYNAPSNGTPPQGNYYPPAPPNGNNNFNNYNQPKNSHNAAAIIWLILFFPVGLYFMWAKTNWNKIVKIVITCFFALLLLIGFIGAGNQSELPASSSGITSITLEDENIRLDKSDLLNDNKLIYVDFTDNGSAELLNSDFVFVFSNEDVASAEVQSILEYSKQASVEISALNTGTTTMYVDFTDNGSAELLNSDFVFVFSNEDVASAEVQSILEYSKQASVEISALNTGTTTMYVQSLDGTIKSNEINIEVIGETETTEETTTETTTQETTTERETTTRETTTEETTKDNSRTVYTTPTGEKYHFSKSCAGKNAIEHTLNEVKDTYEPCKKCAQ